MLDKHLGLMAMAMAMAPSLTQAAMTCAGPLASVSDRIGFQETLFEPQYSPSLSHTGGAISDHNMSKRLSKADVKRLQTPAPIVAASGKLKMAGATWLKDTLNKHADFQVPGWLSTALGLAAPVAWVGVSADVMSQLINGSGSAGKVKLANLAGTVSEGGVVAAFERVAKGAGGELKFLWSYAYTADLNGKSVTTLLCTCSADVVETP